MRRHRTKRAYEVAKRCHCRDRNTCEHHWWLRVKVRGHKRQRIDLTELFPGDAVEVAAAKAKDLARKGLIAAGNVLSGQPADTRLTCSYVAKKFTESRGGGKH